MVVGRVAGCDVDVAEVEAGVEHGDDELWRSAFGWERRHPHPGCLGDARSRRVPRPPGSGVGWSVSSNAASWIDASTCEFLEAARQWTPAKMGLGFPLLLDPDADVVADLELYERTQRRPGVVHVRNVAAKRWVHRAPAQ